MSLPKILFKPFRLALVQMAVGSDKTANVKWASERVAQAAKAGANLVVLPECFNSPYGTQHFDAYAEVIPEGLTIQALAQMAKDARIYLVGGSIPEREETTGKLYNTSTVFSPQGERIATHRKIHLFDIDVPGKIRFKESDALSPGNQLTYFDTEPIEYGRIGMGICYDIRFPELAMVASRKGCIAMVYPGAFNMTTGPQHWELLTRARAVDNQMYVATCSPARDTSGEGYTAWGHSSVADPSGKVIATTDETDSIVYADLDPKVMEDFRQSVPLSTQRRFDVYPDVSQSASS